jgi:DNA-binding transcriptional regulator YhcF (GntR family)
MKRIEIVYNLVLEEVLEKGNRKMTQAQLSTTLRISLSIVNAALNHLKKMHAVEVHQRNFIVVDPKKVLYYWASVRNLEKDILYSTRAEMPVGEIEKSMPPAAVYAAYSAYKLRFKDVPADYSEVYVYSDKEEIEKRFPPSKKRPNLFVLKPAAGNMTIANMFVDLWNMKEWYARDFLGALEMKIDGILA